MVYLQTNYAYIVTILLKYSRRFIIPYAYIVAGCARFVVSNRKHIPQKHCNIVRYVILRH